MDWLEITTWIGAAIGTLGIAGTIAAMIAFPTVVIPVLQSVVSAILKCRPCLIALVFFASVSGALYGGYWYGRSIEKAVCREGELAAELANREADLEAQSKARSDETERANRLERAAADRALSDAAFIKSLQDRPPGSAWVFDDLDAGVQHPARGKVNGTDAARKPAAPDRRKPGPAPR